MKISAISQLLSLVFVLLVSADLPAQTVIHYDEYNGLSSGGVGNAVQDHRGYIWVASWNGLNRFDGYEFQWVKLTPGDGTTIGTDRIRDIMLSPEGNIWCHSDEAVFLFDTQTYTFKDLTAAEQQKIAPLMGKNWPGMTDSQGNFWYTIPKQNGIFKKPAVYHPAHIIEGTAGMHVRAMMVDKEGRLWIATKEDNAVRIYTSDAQSSLSLSGYLTSQGKISPEKQSFGQSVYCFYQHTNGDVWIGCKPGMLMRWSGEGQLKKVSDDVVYDIKADKKGRLWLATFNTGVKCCPDASADSPVVSASFGGNSVRKILITDGGHAVIATSEGLLTADVNTPNLKDIKFSSVKRKGADAGSLSNDATLDVVQDAEGNIYVATESSGVDRFRMPLDEKTVFEHISTSTSALPSDFCKSLTMMGGGRLMVMGQSNMMVYDLKEKSSVNYAEYFWGDSCRFSECRPLRINGNTWVFAAENGAYAVSEDSMLSRGFVPSILFSHVDINGAGADSRHILNDSILLAPEERNITISYAAIDYSSNEWIYYRTSMDGSSWTKASKSRTLTLFDLSPGTHVLRIQSTDCYGRWVDNIRTLTITVEPFWYETWWAALLLCLLLIAVIAGVTYTVIHIRALHRQRRELLEKLMQTVVTPIEPADHVEGEPAVQEQKPIDSAVYDSPFLMKVRDFVEKNISNADASIDDMADAVAASRSTLNRRLRSMIGITAAQLLIDARMQKAANLLSQARDTMSDAEISISEIAYQCGYTDPHYFSRCFKQKYGVSPSKYASKS